MVWDIVDPVWDEGAAWVCNIAGLLDMAIRVELLAAIGGVATSFSFISFALSRGCVGVCWWLVYLVCVV